MGTIREMIEARSQTGRSQGGKKFVLLGKLSIVSNVILQHHMDDRAGYKHDVGRQNTIHIVEKIEQLCPKLQHSELPISSVTKRGVFDQRQVKIVEARTAKRVAAEGAEAAVERSGTARDVDWDCKKRAVC